MITVLPVERRKSRKDPNEAIFHDSSYSYRVRIHVDGGVLQDIAICHKTFLSLRDIYNRRVQTIKQKLISGFFTNDMRGKHLN